MAVKTINISLDEKLLKEIDKAAKDEYATRSHYIRDALTRSLQEKSLEDRFNKLNKEYEAFTAKYEDTLRRLASK